MHGPMNVKPQFIHHLLRTSLRMTTGVVETCSRYITFIIHFHTLTHLVGSLTVRNYPMYGHGLLKTVHKIHK
jgi:hypothetical protein